MTTTKLRMPARLAAQGSIPLAAQLRASQRHALQEKNQTTATKLRMPARLAAQESDPPAALQRARLIVVQDKPTTTQEDARIAMPDSTIPMVELACQRHALQEKNQMTTTKLRMPARLATQGSTPLAAQLRASQRHALQEKNQTTATKLRMPARLAAQESDPPAALQRARLIVVQDKPTTTQEDARIAMP